MSNLFETSRYYVRIGTVVIDGREVSGYQAVNRDTGIVEYEDTMLPQAIIFANGASDHLDELFNEALTVPDNVVSLN